MYIRLGERTKDKQNREIFKGYWEGGRLKTVMLEHDHFDQRLELQVMRLR